MRWRGSAEEKIEARIEVLHVRLDRGAKTVPAAKYQFTAPEPLGKLRLNDIAIGDLLSLDAVSVIDCLPKLA